MSKKRVVEESTEIVKTREINVPLWEKRLTLWACSGMLLFICTNVVDFKTEFGVLKNELINAIKVIETQSTRIERNTLKLAEHEVELATIKTKISR